MKEHEKEGEIIQNRKERESKKGGLKVKGGGGMRPQETEHIKMLIFQLEGERAEQWLSSCLYLLGVEGKNSPKCNFIHRRRCQ